MLAALRKREGASFQLPELPVTLPDGRTIQAVTPVNDRTKGTYIGKVTLEGRLAMARAAEGGAGKCIDYVLNIRTRLQALGIADAGVEEFAALLATP